MAEDTARRHIDRFTQEFKHLSQHRSWYGMFQDFTEVAALSAHQMPYHQGALAKDAAFEQAEAAYLGAIKPYSREDLDGFTRLFTLTTLALAERPAVDVLGHAYMALDTASRHSGEYFTPPGVSLMMARMILGDVRPQIEARGYVSIAEPACGSGNMLIQAANVFWEQGVDPRRHLVFHAADISRVCFNMCYAQMSLLGLQGVVVHGNSLSGERWDARVTPAFQCAGGSMEAVLDAAERLPASPSAAPEPDRTPQYSFDFDEDHDLER